MAFKLADLFVAISANTDKFDQANAKARKTIQATGDAASRSASLDLPAPGSSGQDAGGAGSSAAAGVADLQASIIPLASKIQQSISAAMAPLSQFASRFSAQFEVVGGTILALSKRIDDHLRFPAAAKSVEFLRKLMREKFADMEGYPRKFADSADKALSLYQTANKVRKFFSEIGDTANKSIAKLSKIKGGNISFDNSTRSIINMKGATEAASSSFRRMGAEVAVALGLFGLVFKAVQFLKEGISSASSLGETMSKVGEVFGSETEKIKKQADEMAAKYGLVKGPILDAAASFGLLGKASGQNSVQAAKLASTMTSLAADASSFYNIPMDQALEKIRSGLVGETEPMRSLGVLLSEAAVEQEAFRLGLARSSAQLTDQVKVQARASLITKGLATATGDLDRTQGSAANQFRKFTGNLQNAATSIGEALLPAVTKGINLLNEFAGWVGSAFANSKGSIEAFGQGVGQVFEIFGAVFRNWRASFEVARLSIVQGLANLGAQFEVLGPNIVKMAQWWVKNYVRLNIDAFNAIYYGLLNLGKNFYAFADAVARYIADPMQGFKPNWTPLLEGFEATVDKFPDLLKAQVVDMSAEIAAAGQPIWDDVQARADKAKAAADMAASAKKGNVDGSAQTQTDKKKGSTTDIASFAHSLQEAASGKGKAVEQTARNTQQAVEQLKKLNNAANKPNPTAVAGAGWQAVGLA
jgi:hypothetical protein